MNKVKAKEVNKPLDERVRETLDNLVNMTASPTTDKILYQEERNQINQATTSILKIIDEYVRSIVPEEKKMINEYKDIAGVHYAEVNFFNHCRQTILNNHKEKMKEAR